MTDREYVQATAIDHYISARQQGEATPTTVEPADALMVDALQQLAATTTADPAFVTQLAEVLTRQPGPQSVTPPIASTPSTASLPWWRALRWPRPQLRLATALVTVLVVALLTLVGTTPTVRATVWDLLYGFGLVEEGAVQRVTAPAIRPLQSADGSASLDLAAINQQAGFTVPTPQWLPDDLHLTGGFVEPITGGVQVTLAYHRNAPPSAGYALDDPLLFLVISQGPIDHRPLVAEEWLTPLPVGKGIGMYAHGNWAGDQTTADALTNLRWNAGDDATWLTWQNAGLNYLLYTQGLGVDRATTVQIAESMIKE